jgi:hypothetical protein
MNCLHPPLIFIFPHMKRILASLFAMVAPLVFSGANNAFAQETNAVAAIVTNAAANAVVQTTNGVVENTATNPVPRDAAWVKRHKGFVQTAQRGG